MKNFGKKVSNKKEGEWFEKSNNPSALDRGDTKDKVAPMLDQGDALAEEMMKN